MSWTRPTQRTVRETPEDSASERRSAPAAAPTRARSRVRARTPAAAVSTSKSELHDLLAKPALEGIPTLILGNKNDLSASIGVDELIERLELKSLANREVCCYSISAKNAVNIDITMDWLIKHSKTAR